MHMIHIIPNEVTPYFINFITNISRKIHKIAYYELNYNKNYELNYNKNNNNIVCLHKEHKKNSSSCKAEQYDFESTMTNTYSKKNPNSESELGIQQRKHLELDIRNWVVYYWCHI